jgi:hypothetical protein
MDEDANRALGLAEDAGDLCGRHLLDESKDDRAATVGGQAGDGPPRLGGLVAERGIALDVDRVSDVGSSLDGRGRAATARPAVVRDDVASDPEEPDAERRSTFAVGRSGPLLESVEVRECSEERALRDVFGFVMVSELIEGVAVDLGEIASIQGIELGWVVTRRVDERAIPIEMADSSAALL